MAPAPPRNIKVRGRDRVARTSNSDRQRGPVLALTYATMRELARRPASPASGPTSPVVAVVMRPQTRGQTFAARADLRMRPDGRETRLGFADQLRGGPPIVLSDEAPDVDEVLLGTVGYAQASRAANCSSPLRMMRAASKSRTRPAAMSASPS